jgi:hypothetical protein
MTTRVTPNSSTPLWNETVGELVRPSRADVVLPGIRFSEAQLVCGAFLVLIFGIVVGWLLRLVNGRGRRRRLAATPKLKTSEEDLAVRFENLNLGMILF